MPTPTEIQDIALALNAALDTSAFALSPDGTGLSCADTSQLAGNVDVAGAPGAWTIELTGATEAAPLPAPLFGGFTLGLAGFTATIAGSDVRITSAPARIDLPFFSEGQPHAERLDVELATTPDGISLRLAQAQTDPNQQGKDGKPIIVFALDRTVGTTQKLLRAELSVDSMDLPEQDGRRWISFDGDLTVKVTTSDDSSLDFSLPKSSFKSLRIANDGSIDCSHAWLDLGKKIGIDRGPFRLHLTKVGFGADPVGGARNKWIGFAGDVSIGSGLKAGGAVRGLRIDLETGDVSLAGLDIALEIPSVLTLKGSLDHVHARDKPEYDATDSKIGLPQFVTVDGVRSTPYPLDIVKGAIDLKLIPVHLGLDAQFVAGSVAGVAIFGIVVEADFGVGIPLFAGINLKALQGMFAYNLRPDPTSDDPPHTWWQWYRYPTRDDGTLIVQDDPADGTTDATSETGDPAAGDDDGPDDSFSATSLQKWLKPNDSAWGFAVGAAIGTTDGGHIASAGVLFTLMFPGPVFMISGKADVLRSPIKSPKEEGLFHALAVYDAAADTFDLAIDMHYKVPKVVDVHGTAELFISKNNGWYLALGKPRHDQRVSARIVDTFVLDAYFVVGDDGVVVGAYVGWHESWGFGPLQVSLGAHLAVLAAIQWSPFELAGGIQIGGEAALSAFGIGVGVSIDALVEACAPNPFWVHGEIDVSLDLPWPLPDLSASIGLSWGGDDGTVPPAPLALSTVQAVLGDDNGLAVEHTGTSDHYTLLAHTTNPPPGDVYLSYNDPGHAALVRGDIGGAAEWQRRSADPQGVLPPDDLTQLQNSAAPAVALVPQDVHLLLTFARPVVDQLGFPGAHNADVHDDVEAAQIPNLLPADDMSNLNPNPPTPRFAYRSFLRQVTVYEHRYDGWHAVASRPTLSEGEDLAGEWVEPSTAPTPTSGQPNVNLVLRPSTTGDDGVKRPILPEAPALYAVKVVTDIKARRAGDTGDGQPVPGSPVVEFAFLQTATGPGLAHLPDMPGAPQPAVPAPIVPAPALGGVFPRGGQVVDLSGYVQWSWPGNGDLAAYWGYGANVEFDEGYVNALYGALAPGDSLGTLHLRCRNRNGRHTLFETTAIHVPSAWPQSAVVASPLDLGPAPTLDGSGGPPRYHLVETGLKELRESLRAGIERAGSDASAVISPKLSGSARTALELAAATAGMPSHVTAHRPEISLGQASRLIGLLDDAAWVSALAQIWPAPLRASTRYAMDVVGGPLISRREMALYGTDMPNETATGLAGMDPEQRYQAVEKFLEREDSLTSLYHFEFQTSRYRRFTDQFANALTQSDDPTHMVRRYLGDVDPQAWLADASHAGSLRAAQVAYLAGRADLASFMSSFDESDPRHQESLRDKRLVVGADWDAFSSATAAAFDQLLTDLGWAELASTRVVPPTPDTELSAIVDARDHVTALLLQSPEPIPWRRVWQWVGFDPVAPWAAPLRGLDVLWCTDQTRAVVVPTGKPRGSYALRLGFHGDIGAEAACILSGPRPATENVVFGPLQFAPPLPWPPRRGGLGRAELGRAPR